MAAAALRRRSSKPASPPATTAPATSTADRLSATAACSAPNRAVRVEFCADRCSSLPQSRYQRILLVCSRIRRGERRRSSVLVTNGGMSSDDGEPIPRRGAPKVDELILSRIPGVGDVTNVRQFPIAERGAACSIQWKVSRSVPVSPRSRMRCGVYQPPPSGLEAAANFRSPAASPAIAGAILSAAEAARPFLG
jgi:hypothetical protein